MDAIVKLWVERQLYAALKPVLGKLEVNIRQLVLQHFRNLGFTRQMAVPVLWEVFERSLGAPAFTVEIAFRRGDDKLWEDLALQIRAWFRCFQADLDPTILIWPMDHSRCYSTDSMVNAGESAS
jgi:hypothetical protein